MMINILVACIATYIKDTFIQKAFTQWDCKNIEFMKETGRAFAFDLKGANIACSGLQKFNSTTINLFALIKNKFFTFVQNFNQMLFKFTSNVSWNTFKRIHLDP